MSQDKPNQDRTNSEHKQARPVVEWITFGVSLGILLLLVGLLTYDYFVHEEKPPELGVRLALQAVEQRGTGYYLPVEVSNSGHEAAGDVQVNLTLIVEGEEVEESQIAIKFLAGLDSIVGTAVFETDPGLGEIEVDVGFVEQ